MQLNIDVLSFLSGSGLSLTMIVRLRDHLVQSSPRQSRILGHDYSA